MSNDLKPLSFIVLPLDVFAFVEQCGFIDDVELALLGN
jgi:hypothetical protein